MCSELKKIPRSHNIFLRKSESDTGSWNPTVTETGSKAPVKECRLIGCRAAFLQLMDIEINNEP